MNQQSRADSIHLISSPTLPYFRSVNGIAILARYVEKYGIHVNTLLTGSGLHPRDLDDPEMFVTP